MREDEMRGGRGGLVPALGWVTARGDLSAGELEQACARRGVRLDRARRTYWQAQRVFPRPERRLLRPPAGNGGFRGYYHHGTVDLAELLDFAMRADHPAKRRAWRCRAADLAPVLTGWRHRFPADEDAFYEHVGRTLRAAVSAGWIADLTPVHGAVLPDGQRRVPVHRLDEAVSTAGLVAEAIADAWLDGHALADTPPDRLVVWFRLERTGPDRWRIAGTGARRTSGHHRPQQAAR
ncbi:MAG: hypothetical protein IT200_05760 [Thermoleophilia bacterium]|nr:hypothetical protein [Thermoleophilia bacterium]